MTHLKHTPPPRKIRPQSPFFKILVNTTSQFSRLTSYIIEYYSGMDSLKCHITLSQEAALHQVYSCLYCSYSMTSTCCCCMHVNKTLVLHCTSCNLLKCQTYLVQLQHVRNYTHKKKLIIYQ